MLEIKNISKKYITGAGEFTALENVSLDIEKGDFVAVQGASGAGKSTLLNIIGGLIRPDTGEVRFNGRNIYDGNSRMIAGYRKKHIGFMFQQFHLMPWLTVLENIQLGFHGKLQEQDLDNYLEKCNLSELKHKYPSDLSVGEKQRTAFIRAIIKTPEILLADEPTGNLDPENGRVLMQLVGEYHRNGGTVILVSHDPGVTEYTGRLLILDKGKIAPIPAFVS